MQLPRSLVQSRLEPFLGLHRVEKVRLQVHLRAPSRGLSSEADADRHPAWPPRWSRLCHQLGLGHHCGTEETSAKILAPQSLKSG